VTGEDFLAVRAGPRTSASQIGELFNGDEVTILRRRGNWFRIDAEDIGLGWAFANTSMPIAERWDSSSFDICRYRDL
jgi:uncharacterized protein YraI